MEANSDTAEGGTGGLVHGGALLDQLRQGWTPLPNRVVLSLVLAGLRVRLSRSVVTMVTVVLAIAFLTYTGLTTKLHRNLAGMAIELSELAGIAGREVRQAVASLEGLDLAAGLRGGPRDWLRVWTPPPAGDLEKRLAAMDARAEATSTAISELQRALELRHWLDGKSRGKAGEDSVEAARTYFRLEARRLLSGFSAPSLWSAEQLIQAKFLAEALREHPASPPAAPLIADVVRLEESKRSGVRLVTSLRKAGVNIEATLAGNVAGTWVIVMALMLCTVGIANAMLMSVTERFREIGTMKCLGAQDGLVVKLFLLESAFLGVAGALLGIALGVFIALAAAVFQFGTFGLKGFPILSGLDIIGLALLSGILLAVVGTAYPAILASRMKPVDALRVDE